MTQRLRESTIREAGRVRRDDQRAEEGAAGEELMQHGEILLSRPRFPSSTGMPHQSEGGHRVSVLIQASMVQALRVASAISFVAGAVD